jgi:DNA polymerase III epsilon subunit-like protein
MSLVLLDDNAQLWRHAIREYYGYRWPRDYVVLDTETCGVQPFEDYALQLGCVIVRNDVVVHQSSVYLDWVGTGLVPGDWLRNRMAAVAAQMAERGSAYRMNFETVCQQGQDPRVVIPALASILRDGVKHGLALVGHNLAAFDLVLLSRHIRDLTPERLLIPVTAVYDTGMLVKALQLNSVPGAGENPVEWFQRTYNRRAKVKWKLDGWCADTYNLWARSGLDPAAAHDALSDCLLTHHLFTALRDFVEGPDVGQTQLAS